jgi:(R,R)-butanediol dehydrogenase / meso-butanediol dehydrogenase / diacetyl reductase
MRAGVFRGTRQLVVEQVADPVAGPHDIVLDVRASGVCGSDLHAYTGGLSAPAGRIMGHEFAGEVVGAGEAVAGISVGDRVTGVPIQPCGACRRCREGAGHLCEVWNTRSIAFGLPGAFAERLRIPHAVAGQNVHRLPDAVTTEAGALVEPLSVALHSVRQAAPRAGQAALVLGLGTIGLLIAQALLARGVSPVLGVDRSPLRRELAERLGIHTHSDAADVPGEPEIDLVFEVTGAPPLVARAAELARPRGTVVIVALYEDIAPIDPTLVVHKELVLRGSAMVTPEDFRDALDLLATARVRAEPLITHRLPLADIDDAFRTQLDPNHSVKVLIVP